jgi:hypothetical protein
VIGYTLTVEVCCDWEIGIWEFSGAIVALAILYRADSSLRSDTNWTTGSSYVEVRGLPFRLFPEVTTDLTGKTLEVCS